MDRFAQVCDEVAQTGSRRKKVRLLSEYLRGLSDEDLPRVVRFLCARPLARTEAELSIGHSRLRDALMEILPWEPEIVRLCFREVGDAGEAIGLLLEGFTRREPMTLASAELLYQRLYYSRRAAGKVSLLTSIFLQHRPRTLQYFIKVITGDLRIGLKEKIVEEAVAAAARAAHDAVRKASNRSGDLPAVALAARRGRLHAVEASLFHAMDFMLAKPVDQVREILDPAIWLVEDKYDGIRAQIHASGDKVMIFTRSLDEASSSYPEIAAAVQALPHSVVLDGEVLAWRGGSPLPFFALQRRLSRKRLTAEILEQVPVIFMAYDILYLDGDLLLDTPLEQRRALLEQTLAGHGAPLLVSPQQRADNLETRFTEARERGNEGLVLKRPGSAYESGRRSGAWVKIKRPYATLDVVITAAERGHGKRATLLSDYTFAIRDGARLVNIGKAYSGLTDSEIRELTRLLPSLAQEESGRVLLVRPAIVLEVAFDAIQRSKRHASGYALRFPRIVRWRRDKTPDQADSLARVRQLHEGRAGVRQSRAFLNEPGI